jgi:hypothetical protein
MLSQCYIFTLAYSKWNMKINFFVLSTNKLHEANSHLTNQEITHILQNPKIHHCLYEPTINKDELIHILTPHFFKIYFNITSPISV